MSPTAILVVLIQHCLQGPKKLQQDVSSCYLITTSRSTAGGGCVHSADLFHVICAPLPIHMIFRARLMSYTIMG